MRLKLNDQWLVASDDNCFKLVRVTTAGADAKPENVGKERENVVGYFGKLSQACTAYLERSLMDLETVSISVLIDHLDKVEAEVRAVCGDAGIVPAAVQRRTRATAQPADTSGTGPIPQPQTQAVHKTETLTPKAVPVPELVSDAEPVPKAPARKILRRSNLPIV